MKCTYCEEKEFNVMKLKCSHYVCIFCISDIKKIKHDCCTFPNKNNNKKINLNEVNVHWYDTMYDYDNGII